MKKVTATVAIILFFFVFLFLIFNKKEEVKKEIEDLNFQSNAEKSPKKENVLGLFDKKLEIPKETNKIQKTSNKQSTNNKLTNKDEEESNNEDKEEKDEEEDEEEIPNPTSIPNPNPTPTPQPTVETEKEETLGEKTDFISESLTNETFAEKEIIEAVFLPDLVSLFGVEELSKVFVGVEKIEFSNLEQNGNEGKAGALVKTSAEEKLYKCYFYKISNKWYLYKTE